MHSDSFPGPQKMVDAKQKQVAETSDSEELRSSASRPERSEAALENAKSKPFPVRWREKYGRDINITSNKIRSVMNDNEHKVGPLREELYAEFSKDPSISTFAMTWAGRGSGKTILWENLPRLRKLLDDDKIMTDDNSLPYASNPIEKVLNDKKDVIAINILCPDKKDPLERMIDRNEITYPIGKFCRTHAREQNEWMRHYDHHKEKTSRVSFVLLTNPKSVEEDHGAAFSSDNICDYDGEEAYRYAKLNSPKKQKEMEADAIRNLDRFYIRRFKEGRQIDENKLAIFVKHDRYVIPDVTGSSEQEISQNTEPEQSSATEPSAKQGVGTLRQQHLQNPPQPTSSVNDLENVVASARSDASRNKRRTKGQVWKKIMGLCRMG